MMIKHLKSLSERQILLILAFIVGLLSGVAAIILKSTIHFLQNLFTNRIGSNIETWLYFVLPGCGMLLSLLFVRYIVKEPIGHGVSKVLQAISRKESKIKPHNCWTSIVASAVTIGFGGSVGAEAPIVYAGAAIGSNIARKLGLNYRQMTLLLVCGAAGAIAGIFKAPLAGLLFSLEILLFNLSMSSILPLLVSTITATVLSYAFLGSAVDFHNAAEPYMLYNLPFYFVLGICSGFVSLYFTRVTLLLESRIQRVTNLYKRWLFTAIGMGILIFIFPPLYGEGYSSLTSLLNNDVEGAVRSVFSVGLMKNPWYIPLFFLCVMFFKVLAMTFTNAGGGVGGTFGPTLFVGGVLGFVFSRMINLSGIYTLPEANFALVGMAGLMAGVMQAPLTAIFLIAEITGGYSLLVPLIITSIASYATIHTFEPYSIYSKRLAQAGDLLTHDQDQAVLTLLKTSQLIETDLIPVRSHYTLGQLVEVVANSKRNIFPVVDSAMCLQGIVTLDDIRQIMFDKDRYDNIYVYELMEHAPDYVFVDEKMDSVMHKFEVTGAWNLPVLDDEYHYVGFVSKSRIFSAYREQLAQVSNE